MVIAVSLTTAAAARMADARFKQWNQYVTGNQPDAKFIKQLKASITWLELFFWLSEANMRGSRSPLRVVMLPEDAGACDGNV
jgi:hypothetical protein